MRSVGSISPRIVDTAKPGELVHTVARRMASRGVGMLVVVDEGHRPIGVLTDRDLALRVVGAGANALEVTVEDVMTREIECIPEDASLESSLERMRACRVRRLPLVDADQRLVGVVCLDDVLRQIAKEMWEIGRLLERTDPARVATSWTRE